MNKHLLLFLFIFIKIISTATGQENTKSFHLGITLTPQLSTAIFKSDQDVAYHASPSCSASGNLIFDLLPKVQFITGIEGQYAKFNYRDYSPLFPEDFDPNTGMALPHKSYWDFKYSFFYIGLPLQIKLKLNEAEKPNHFYFMTGLTIRYRVSTGGYYQLVESGMPSEKTDLDSFFFKPDEIWLFGCLGAGYEMQGGNKKLSFGPVFEYSPGQLYNDQGSSAIANAHPAYFGIRLSYY